jgi:DNA-binding MarR family transcriptional regulator
VSLKPLQDEYNRQILQAIASGQPITQRYLAGELGVALGLANLLVRRLVGKGYVRMAGMGTRHVRYLMTSAGWDALRQATRQSLENTVRLYSETRELIRAGLSDVSSRCGLDEAGQKRVVFYGAGDVAEIAYVSLQRTDLMLVGVVDDKRAGRFFHMPIHGSDQLSAHRLGDVPYAHVVVTSVRHAAAIRARLDARSVPAHRVSYLQASMTSAVRAYSSK